MSKIPQPLDLIPLAMEITNALQRQRLEPSDVMLRVELPKVIYDLSLEKLMSVYKNYMVKDAIHVAGNWADIGGIRFVSRA